MDGGEHAGLHLLLIHVRPGNGFEILPLPTHVASHLSFASRPSNSASENRRTSFSPFSYWKEKSTFDGRCQKDDTDYSVFMLEK